MGINILIAGDTCPIGCNEIIFRNNDSKTLLGDFIKDFESADLVIANLECPLIINETPIYKTGPNLGASTGCAKGLKGIGIDIVGLANNHIMDHGVEGLKTTISALEENGINFVGAGNNLKAARNILIREIHGIRIGIMALAEHEFGIANDTHPGANPLDVIDFVRNVSEHRSEFDILIVILHGGNEYFPYPSPRLQNTSRFLVEQGANAVICQHTHCVGCMEIYLNAPIVYGHGNFLFDYPSIENTWNEGALIYLNSKEKGNFKIRLIPYLQSDGKPGMQRMGVDEEKYFLNAFTKRSKAISDKSFVLKNWESFCQKKKPYYLNNLRGKPGFLRRLGGRLDMLHYFDSLKVRAGRLNIVRCESHCEALLTALTQEMEQK